MPLILHQFSPQNNQKIADYVKHPDFSFKPECQIITMDIKVIFVNTGKYMKQEEGNTLCNKFHLSAIIQAYALRAKYAAICCRSGEN